MRWITIYQLPYRAKVDFDVLIPRRGRSQRDSGSSASSGATVGKGNRQDQVVLVHSSEQQVFVVDDVKLPSPLRRTEKRRTPGDGEGLQRQHDIQLAPDSGRNNTGSPAMESGFEANAFTVRRRTNIDEH